MNNVPPTQNAEPNAGAMAAFAQLNAGRVLRPLVNLFTGIAVYFHLRQFLSAVGGGSGDHHGAGSPWGALRCVLAGLLRGGRPRRLRSKAKWNGPAAPIATLMAAFG